jgi:hypothetical protein
MMEKSKERMSYQKTQSINESIAKYNISEIRHCSHQPGDVLKTERADTSDRCMWICNGKMEPTEKRTFIVFCMMKEA